ncbi:dipeptidase [Candidatus Bathyarchaeota archaeon]|nr:dipeptidase [Candidatus Bathyarchaeota archaeon]
MIELSKSQEERAMRLHKEAIVIDTHCDSLGGYLPSRGRPTKVFAEDNETGQIDLPKLVKGGVTCQVFAICTASGPIVPDATFRALKQVDYFYNVMNKLPNFTGVTTADEIVEAKNKGVVTGLLALEGAEPLMGDIALMRVFYQLGFRMISFCHNNRTPWADGLGFKRSEGKLPELGVKGLEEIQRLGIVFDVSHITDHGFWDVCDLMKGPFIASHSNCRALCDVPRNLTDDMIHALADHDGVMGMNYLGGFVAKENANLEKMVDHIDRIVNLVGPNHVGLGSDYDGGGRLPELNDTSMVPNMTRELVKREYSDEDILKILGGNFLRVFKKVLK